jgi:putative ABC transport system permease protein
VLGFALALGIRMLFGRVGLDLGASELVLRPRTVVVALVVGLVVTLAAAYLPARRAGRVPPVAAMRDDAALAESGLRWRVAVGALLLVAGVVAMGLGLAGVGSEPTYVLGGGAFGVLVGTALLSPVLGRPVLAGLGWVYRRAFGAVGLMAEQNSRRNPRRTAATASALMIGVALVTMMAVLGASAKASLDKTLAEDIVADYVVSNVVGQTFSASIASDIEGLPGVGEVARVRGAVVEVDGDRDFATAVDPARVTSVARPEVVTGSLADLDESSVAISSQMATDQGLAVGSSVTVGFAGEEQPRKVVATYTPNGPCRLRRRAARGGPGRAASRARRRRRGPADGERQRPGRVRGRAAQADRPAALHRLRPARARCRHRRARDHQHPGPLGHRADP